MEVVIFTVIGEMIRKYIKNKFFYSNESRRRRIFQAELSRGNFPSGVFSDDQIVRGIF